MEAQIQDGCVDGVGAEEGEDVAAGPGECADETSTKRDGEVSDLGIIVGAACVAVDEEVYIAVLVLDGEYKDRFLDWLDSL